MRKGCHTWCNYSRPVSTKSSVINFFFILEKFLMTLSSNLGKVCIRIAIFFILYVLGSLSEGLRIIVCQGNRLNLSCFYTWPIGLTMFFSKQLSFLTFVYSFLFYHLPLSNCRKIFSVAKGYSFFQFIYF